MSDDLLKRLADDAAWLESKGITISSIRQARFRIRELEAEREWRPIAEAPRCVDGATSDTPDNGKRPVLVCRFPFTGHHAPQAIARLTRKGWVSGRKGNPLWFEPTHFRLLPAPPKEEE